MVPVMNWKAEKVINLIELEECTVITDNSMQLDLIYEYLFREKKDFKPGWTQNRQRKV